MRLRTYEQLVDIRSQHMIQSKVRVSNARNFRQQYLEICTKYIGEEATNPVIIQHLKNDIDQLLTDFGEDPTQLSYTIHLSNTPNTLYITPNDDLTTNVFNNYRL